MVVVTERQKFMSGELCPIVGDDGVWNSKPVDDVCEEQYCLLGFDLSDRSSLDPLGELVNGYQQVGIAPRGFLQRPNHVQSPYGERPCDGDGLEGLGWEVRLPRIVLTSLAGAYQLGGVGNRRWPVEPLAESISDECPRRNMVPAGSHVESSSLVLVN